MALGDISSCQNAPRCLAKTRRGTPCQSPVVRGKARCRMHGGAPGTGAPAGNRNGWKHGLYSQLHPDASLRRVALSSLAAMGIEAGEAPASLLDAKVEELRVKRELWRRFRERTPYSVGTPEYNRAYKRAFYSGGMCRRSRNPEARAENRKRWKYRNKLARRLGVPRALVPASLVDEMIASWRARRAHQ